GGANEVVMGDFETLPQRVIALHHLVGQRDGGHPPGGGGVFDLLPVLVGSGQEVDLLAQDSMKAREDVGHDGGVDVADVGRVVDVIDRGGDVVAAHRAWNPSVARR